MYPAPSANIDCESDDEMPALEPLARRAQEEETQDRHNLSALRRGAEHCYFRPALFWQTVQSWHVADIGLEFKVNLSTGVNQCRFPNTLNIEENECMLSEAKATATRLVRRVEGREDAAALSKRLRDAATWGDADLLTTLLRSCYVTQDVALPALAEASARGLAPIVDILIAAGVDAGEVIPELGKNAFHIACEAGQELVATSLLRSMQSLADVERRTAARIGAKTGFELLRLNDLGGIARRLEVVARDLFSEQSGSLS
jgi:hypothetical protein